MIAPSGCGKSRRFMAHNINDLNNSSIIVTDPSCELEKMSTTHKTKYILNPFSNNTIGYDPLYNCQSEFEVRKIAKVILINGMNSSSSNNKNSNQIEWVNMATPLLTSYMLMNYHTKKYTFDELIKNICTMPIISDIQKDDKGTIIKATMSIELEIVMSDVESAITEFKSFKQVMGAAPTLASIRTVMNTCLQLFLDNNLKKVFHRPNISFSKIRQEESIVYIQIPEHHSDYFSPLVATFLTQMFDYLLENDGLQCYFLLDEMCNNGIIPSFDKLLSTARKHNVSIVGATQSLLQLNTLYGELQGKTINELFKTILVCGGLKDSAEYFSNLLGTTEITDKYSSIKTIPLMTSSEIRLLPQGQMLIICNNKRPVIDDMMDIVA